MHFTLIKPLFSDHLFYVTLFQCSLGRSHKTCVTVVICMHAPHAIIAFDLGFVPFFNSTCGSVYGIHCQVHSLH